MVQVLSQLPLLRSLSLKGCPVAALPGYPAQILAMLPRLKILDNQRLDSSRGRVAAATDGAAPVAQLGAAAPGGRDGAGGSRAAKAGPEPSEEQPEVPRKRSRREAGGGSELAEHQQHAPRTEEAEEEELSVPSKKRRPAAARR